MLGFYLPSSYFKTRDSSQFLSFSPQIFTENPVSFFRSIVSDSLSKLGSISLPSLPELFTSMGDPSASYIHMVHRLIEACLVFNMTKEECMEALSKHANIGPVITSTVWNELEKENKEFFESYFRNRKEEKKKKTGDGDANRKIHQILADSSVVSNP